MKVKKIAEMYNIANSTVSTIVRKKESMKEKMNATGHAKLDERKRLRMCKNHEVEEAVTAFICHAMQNQIPLSGPIIQAKAKFISEKMNVSNFLASNGWLAKYKHRTGLKWKLKRNDKQTEYS